MDYPLSYFDNEVRDGFYIPGLMKRCWAAELEVLMELDRICRKHNIRYYAAYGTLLGAVRHKGFIPWDDDMDIWMMRDDYISFCQIVNEELPEELSISINEVEYENKDRISAMGLNRYPVMSLGIEEKYHCFPFGVAVDIFVLDTSPVNTEEELLRNEELKALYALHNISLKKGEDSEELKDGLIKIEKGLGISFDRKKSINEQIVREEVALMLRYKSLKSPLLADLAANLVNFKIVQFNKSWFGEAIYLPFEGIMLPVPSEYDKCLKAQYGENYMEPYKGAGHEYPFFEEDKNKMEGDFDKSWLFKYRFSPEDLKHEKKQNLREICEEAILYIESLHRKIRERINCIENNLDECMEMLSDCQGLAIQMGELIEAKKSECNEIVECLQNYCEEVFMLYSSMTSGDDEDEKNTETDIITEEGKFIELLANMDDCLNKCSTAVFNTLKKTVLLMPSRASHWASFKELYNVLSEKPEYELKIMPIPYCYRNTQGAMGELLYDGDKFPEGIEICDYRSYDFASERPDFIVISTAQDNCSYTDSVEPYFYSANLKQFTNCLIYLPWFKTDEVSLDNPQDKAALKNMEHYVTVPGVVRSDYTIVQSDAMRKIYLHLLGQLSEEAQELEWEERLLTADEYIDRLF